MAKSNNNVITHGLSGKIGDMLVFTQRNGKTIVGKLPDKSHVEQSDKQKAVNKRFQEAVIYAKVVVADAALKAEYESKAGDGKSAYNVAIADFFNAPDIEEINLSNYHGLAGQQIIIRATDDFKVVQVRVIIYNSDASLVEQGDAVISSNGVDWIYTATANTDQQTGDKLVIQASDLPGNLTERQENL